MRGLRKGIKKMRRASLMPFSLPADLSRNPRVANKLAIKKPRQRRGSYRGIRKGIYEELSISFIPHKNACARLRKGRKQNILNYLKKIWMRIITRITPTRKKLKLIILLILKPLSGCLVQKARITYILNRLLFEHNKCEKARWLMPGNVRYL